MARIPTYSKSERMVLIFLLTTSVIALAILLILGRGGGGEDTSTVADTLTQRDFRGRQNGMQGRYYAEENASELFPFDPNTADSTQLLRLGLAPWQVRAIYKYRAKGGYYATKADFARLYGLTAKKYRELEPYIQISSDYRPASETVEPATAVVPRQERDTLHHPQKLRPGERISANTADTTLLKRVPGIGSYKAWAIVSYRERLGGFVSREQLLDIPSFPAEALEYFREPTEPVRRINLNKATKMELSRHPYLGYFQVKSILEYKRKHGRIESLNDFALDRDFPASLRKRLEPYVEF